MPLRLLQISVIALVLLTLVGFTGNGPFGWLKRSSRSAPVSADAPPPTPSTTLRRATTGPTSSTIAALRLRAYEKGQCVTWDQQSTDYRQDTSVVPCAQPHLVEIAGSIQVHGQSDRYPTDAQWRQTFDRDCLPLVERLIGGPLDPVGRFHDGGIRPLADAWSAGNRTVWCGAIIATDHIVPFSELGPFPGKIEGAAQTRLDPVGTCWVSTSNYPVSCAKSHDEEITGYVDLTGRTSPPPALDDDNAWNALVGQRCTAMARAYLGHGFVNGEVGGWVPILPASWAAGRRIAECSVLRVAAQNRHVAIVGSLKG